MNALKIRGWIWFAVLLLLFIGVSYVAFTPKPKIYPDYVTTSPAPTGIKAIYTYLKKEKGVKSWNHSPDLLPKGDNNQMLVMVGPAFTPEKELMQAYKAYMNAGNTILLLQTNPKGMFDLEADFIEKSPSQSKRWHLVKDQNYKTFKAEVNSDVRIRTIKGDELLLSDQYGPIAVKRTFGKGHLIVAITPEWFTNDKLLKKDHLPLSFQLLNRGNPDTILFDEYTHVGENKSSILAVYPMWFLVLIFQGILLVVFWLWYKGKRFGPLLSPREEWVRFSDEGIQAIAAWYLKGRRYQDSLHIQADYVKVLLQERWHIPYHKGWQELTPYFERKWIKIPAHEMKTFLYGLAAILNQEKINKQEYLLWSRKLEELRNEVES
ncbi:DUF4350 domain-containing protein [Neobacillus cucumis]|uniref:DUF4350 domain-containing protein n=1 Tax=Neobacillus cucumis TaxID=1740721 RepID=UPI00203B657C|nr:DUF4350 domain-containing protein [Neobacillus cucumis]MCM3727466.1 DUF4350 domain-containing protein [Neobacillus cucumis]